MLLFSFWFLIETLLFTGDSCDSQIQRRLLWADSQCRHGWLHPSREDFWLTWCVFYVFYNSQCSKTWPLLTVLHFFLPILTEALIVAINNDIEEAKLKLELPEHRKLKEDNFFISAASSSPVSSTTPSTSETIANGHWQLAVRAAHCMCSHTNVAFNAALFWRLSAAVMAVQPQKQTKSCWDSFFNPKYVQLLIRNCSWQPLTLCVDTSDFFYECHGLYFRFKILSFFFKNINDSLILFIQRIQMKLKATEFTLLIFFFFFEKLKIYFCFVPFT